MASAIHPHGRPSHFALPDIACASLGAAHTLHAPGGPARSEAWASHWILRPGADRPAHHPSADGAAPAPCPVGHLLRTGMARHFLLVHVRAPWRAHSAPEANPS